MSFQTRLQNINGRTFTNKLINQVVIVISLTNNNRVLYYDKPDMLPAS